MTPNTPHPPAPYPPPPYRRPPRSRPGLFFAGVVHLVFAGLTGLAWFYCAIGVGMCTDAGSRAYCDRLTGQWTVFGWTAVLNAVVALTAIVQSRSGRRPALCRCLGWAIAAGLIAGIVAFAVLWSTGSAPVS